VAIDQTTALIFAIPVIPLCLYVIWSDMRAMKIYNWTVMTLACVFVVTGLFALPFDVYLWRYVSLVAVLALGFVLNAAGVLGAGDAKFAAAAAPFIDPVDTVEILRLFPTVLLAAYVTHRVIRATPLRAMAPHWESWVRKKDFPMGMALGGTLAIYLAFGIFLGA
jgi:prepilin peptidase CpaA